MHELGIATNIVEIVEHEIDRHNYGQVALISLRIGAMTDVDHEALRFGFEVITKGTRLDGTRLEIEAVPIRVSCNDCNHQSEVARFDFVCRACGSRQVTMLQGTELDIAYLEVDDSAGTPTQPLSRTESI